MKTNPAIGQRVWYTGEHGVGYMAIVCGVHYIRDEGTTVNLSLGPDSPVLYNVPYSPEYVANSYADEAPPAPKTPPTVSPSRVQLGSTVWYTGGDGMVYEALVRELRWDASNPRGGPRADLDIGDGGRAMDIPHSGRYAPHTYHVVHPSAKAPHHSCGPTMRANAAEENAWREKVRGMTDASGKPYPPVYDQGALGSCSASDVQGERYYMLGRLKTILVEQQPPAGGRLDTPSGVPLELAHEMHSRAPQPYPLARYVEEWAAGLNKARNAVNHMRATLPDGDPARYFLDPPLNDLQRLSHALAMVKSRLQERTTPLIRREQDMSDVSPKPIPEHAKDAYHAASAKGFPPDEAHAASLASAHAVPHDAPAVPIGAVVSYTPVTNMEVVAIDGTRSILTAPGPYAAHMLGSRSGLATLGLLDHRGKPVGAVEGVPYSDQAQPGTWCMAAEPVRIDLVESLRAENRALGKKLGDERQAQETLERQYAESLHDKDTRISQLTSYLEKNTGVMAEDAETIRGLQDKLRYPVSSRPIRAYHIDWESVHVTDGGGGGEPDVISLGHEEDGTWRFAQIEEYQGEGAREYLEYVLGVARKVGAVLDEILEAE